MYQEILFLLDLCIAAYHCHNQTLVFPMDPYYEDLEGYGSRREKFMAACHDAFKNKLNYRGPGACQNWATNKLLDPIISDYRKVYPWGPSFVRPCREKDRWIVYKIPKLISDSIGVVKVSRFTSDPAGPSPTTTLDLLYNAHPNNPAVDGTRDLLYCFEGGTGGVEHQTVAAYSIMGLVLVKKTATLNDHYFEVFIVFRGSRSGEVRYGQSFRAGVGNPDWATNGDCMSSTREDAISEVGQACRGFSASIKKMLPTIMGCLNDIYLLMGTAPRNIHISGHSLGGGLACQFASAVLRGTTYGYGGPVSQMDPHVKLWPWNHMNLVTFSAPVVGDFEFAENFDLRRPSRRFWLDGDIVTQERVHYQFGAPHKIFQDKTVMLDTAGDSHQPYLIRRFLIKKLRAEAFNLANAPANTGEAHPDEPWKLFDDFRSVVLHLIQQGARSFQIDYNAMSIYLIALSLTLKSSEAYTSAIFNSPSQSDITAIGQLISTLITELNRIQNGNFSATQRFNELSMLWKNMYNLGNIRSGTERKTYQFLGLCLLLMGFRDANNLNNDLSSIPASFDDIFHGKF